MLDAEVSLCGVGSLVLFSRVEDFKIFLGIEEKFCNRSSVEDSRASINDEFEEPFTRCGPFQAGSVDREAIGPSRRSLIVAGGIAALAVALGDAAGVFGGVGPARAEPAWYHPFIHQGKVSSHFGQRVSPCAGCSSDHKGIDYSPPGAGTPIHAVAAGTVTFAAKSGSFGNHVIIDHGSSFKSVYAHMQDGSIAVSPGRTISAGTRVGSLGNTGASTGAHLHLELHLNNTPINPYSRIHDALTAEIAQATTTPQGDDDDMPVMIPIIFDQGDSTHAEYASTALVCPYRGWFQTSVGYGSRDVFDFEQSIARSMGITVRPMVHADLMVWSVAKRYVIS